MKKSILVLFMLSVALLSFGCQPKLKSANVSDLDHASSSKPTAVTLDQFKQITADMTYSDIEDLLGETVDVGSGMHVWVYNVDSQLVHMSFTKSTKPVGKTGQELYDSTTLGTIHRDDYLQACSLIAHNYIYLEDKLNMNRDTFLSDCTDYANALDWTGSKEQMVHELRKLLSQFEDGHVSLMLSEPYKLNKTLSLGFIAAYTSEQKVIVSYVDTDNVSGLHVGDEITMWNDKPILDELNSLSQLMPNSTKSASLESTARRLGIDFSFDPLRTKHQSVQLGIKKTDSRSETIMLDWYSCSGYVSYEEASPPSTIPSFFLTNSLVPSLEEIPNDVQYITESLMYYFRMQGNKKIAVLHPRNFSSWSQEELDLTMKAIIDEHPDLLIVDLKDTSGGYFDQVLYLSHALAVETPFIFEYDYIDSATGKRTQGEDQFSTIEDSIHIKNKWTGNVIFTMNGIVKSGGDFFTRWMQLNNGDDRFLFVGTPTSGAGGGTDTFTLDNTNIKISFPLRDRKIKIDTARIEEHAVQPDILTDMRIEELIQLKEIFEFDLKE